LSGDRGDGVEVFVDVEDGQPRELGGGRDDEVGNRRTAVLTPVCEQHLDFQRAILDLRCQILDWHCR
jgi:hypothetical protein